MRPTIAQPSDVRDHAIGEIASGGKLGINASKEIAGDVFKCPDCR